VNIVKGRGAHNLVNQNLNHIYAIDINPDHGVAQLEFPASGVLRFREIKFR